MSEAPAEKKARPTRLRTRLSLAFAIFALNVVTGFGLIQVWIWESTGGGDRGALTTMLLTASVLVVAVAALGGYLLAGPLAKPMEQWAEAADRIGLGERNVTFPQSGGSHELARVSAALQSMFSRLSEKEDQLQARIAERTTALVEATDALAAERDRLSSALEGSRLAFWELNLETGETRLSAEWARMLGEGEAETVTSVPALLERVPEEEHAIVSAKMFAALKGDDPHYDTDHRVRRSDGSLMWIRSRGRVTVRDADGRALRMAGTNVDIAPRKAQEDRQRASEARLRTVLDGVATNVCHVDLGGRILFANRRYHDFYALPDGTAIGRSVRDISGDEGAAAFERCLPQLLAGNEVQYEREVRIQEHPRYIEVRLVPHRDELGVTDSVYAVFTDISERKAAEQLLEHQALTDPTTSLPNRKLFAEQVRRALAQPGGERTAVLYIDLDGFKAMNERLGHEGGNMLLRQVGARYIAAVRGADTVARIDRDEFAVLIESCRSGDDAEVVARKLVDALHAPFNPVGDEVRITCSVGIAVAPADGTEPDALLKSAEKAMAKARKAGANRFTRHS